MDFSHGRDAAGDAVVDNWLDNWAVYRAPNPALRDLTLACLGAGEQAVAEPGFDTRRLDSYALVVVSHGTGRYWAGSDAGGRPQPVVAPALIWLFPGVEHRYAPDPTGWVEHWVTFTGVAAYGYEELGCWSRAKPIVALDRPPADHTRIFGELQRAMRQIDRVAEIEAGALVHRLIAAAVRQAAHGRFSPRQHSIIDALRDGATERVSLQEHAQRVGLSVHAHREAVRAAVGMTPLQFLITVRLARAQALLAETSLRVAEVATAVGYDDPAYFSRLFFRRVGTAPRRFRERQLQSRNRPPLAVDRSSESSR